MSDKEVQRALDDEVRATVEKQQKREKEAEEKKKLGKDADDFAKDFQVYPSVHPPPIESIITPVFIYSLFLFGFLKTL